MFDKLAKLRKSPYEGTPLEGLENCLPKFHSASIILYSGKAHTGGGHGRRRTRNPLQQKLEAWRRRRRLG